MAKKKRNVIKKRTKRERKCDKKKEQKEKEKRKQEKNIKHGLFDTRNERERKERGRRGFFMYTKSVSRTLLPTITATTKRKWGTWSLRYIEKYHEIY